MAKKYAKLKQLFLFNGLIFIIALFLIQYSVVQSEQEGEGQATHVQVEQTYKSRLNQEAESTFQERLTKFDPPFMPHNIRFKNVLGRTMTLDDLKGQWIVLNFWASWCPPCIVEMPSLQALQDTYGGQGVRVVGIGLDRDMNPAKLGQIMQRFNFGPVAAYYGEWPEISAHFDIPTMPSTFILSPSGHVVAKLEGHADWMGDNATSLMEGLIKRKKMR